MPGEEVPRAVDVERVFHVYDDEVVEARFGAWVLARGEFGGRGRDALDGGDVGFLVGGGDVAPEGDVLVGHVDGEVRGSIPFSTHAQLFFRACF